VEADVALDEVNEALGLHLTPKGEVASLGGYLMETLGKMPRKGRVVEDKEAIFKILEASEKNVVKVKVTKRKMPLVSVEAEEGLPAVSKPRRKKVKTPAAEGAVVETSAAENARETAESKVEKPL
jgi:hypothetical protein